MIAWFRENKKYEFFAILIAMAFILVGGVVMRVDTIREAIGMFILILGAFAYTELTED